MRKVVRALLVRMGVYYERDRIETTPMPPCASCRDLVVSKTERLGVRCDAGHGMRPDFSCYRPSKAKYRTWRPDGEPFLVSRGRFAKWVLRA